MRKIKRNILLTPGPATTSDSVKHALVVSDICPREEEFTKLLSEIRRDLTKIVKGSNKEYSCVLFAGSGTAAMDACINSTIPPNKKVAIINNGAYGQRLVNIAQSYGIKHVEIKSPCDKKIDLQVIERILKKDKQITGLAVVHHETTTGLLNPINEIAGIAKKNKCLVIVDAISSYAGIPINIKKSNIDFLMSCSNKCIQGMPGIAFVICNRKQINKLKNYPKRSYYLDLYDQHTFLEKSNQLPFTVPVQIAYSLKQAIKEYFKEGAQNRYRRYTNNWRLLRNGLQVMGFRFLLEDKEEARLLTTILEPDNQGFQFNKFHDLLYKEGISIYPGKISEHKTFRLATIGDLHTKDIKNVLTITRKVLTKLKVKPKYNKKG